MLRATSSIVTIAVVAALNFSCGSKAPNDQSIITGIQSQLYADQVTKPASIAVAVQNGNVTLSGEVPSSDVALEAMKIANGTKGVRTVNDQMTINGVSAASQLPNAGNTTSASPTASNEPAPNNQPTAPPPSSAPPSTPAPVAANTPPPQPETITIPAGERIEVRTIDAISSKTASADTVYRASLNAPLVHDGQVVIPAGAPVSLYVVEDRSAGRIRGQSEIALRATRLEYHGHRYPIQTSLYTEEGKARGKQTAVRTGIGAVAGAIIGGIAGGGKGAAIGSAAGGGAGFGVDLATHGQQVRIPSETVITFRLEALLRVER